MPRPAVGVSLGVGRLRDRRMGLPPLVRRRCAIGSRADERMAEPHAGAELAQPCLGRRRRGRRPDALLLGRAPDEGGLPQRLRRRDEQQPPGVLGQRREPPAELSSIPFDEPEIAPVPNPASSVALRPRGSSTSASGLPRVSATMRSPPARPA